MTRLKLMHESVIVDNKICSDPERENTGIKTLHLPEPDYTKLALEIPPEVHEMLLMRMTLLYGTAVAETYLPEIERLMEVYYAHKPEHLIKRDKDFDPANRFTEKDIILITYGDLIQGRTSSPLKTLAKVCERYLEGTINTLHILPFFPYSSDRGFSITDFETVDPRLGTWEEIEDMEGRFQLMFDGVINHVSAKSRWFQEFLNGNPDYWDFFIHFSSPDELSMEQKKMIFRPRTSALLTKYETINGPMHVWTTFSSDQIDLNYTNPDVLMKVIEILLLYVRRGSDIIRLDAVTYLWAEPGTSCVHLTQTHEIVKLFHDILSIVAPHVALITETNVPHKENISYFGDGHDEARMVYNFALPPLVLYTFYAEDASVLSWWIKELHTPSDTTTFFNFLDSHDGIGVMAIKDILPQEDIDFIIRKAADHGAMVSYKTAEDGTEVPYEINTTWFSAINRENCDEDTAFQVKRFVASRAVALVIQGVPGIYFHSMIGTPNDIESVLKDGSKRAINRTIIDGRAVQEELKNPLSKVSRISRELGRLMTIRTCQKPFHPNGGQEILNLSSDVFAVYRTSPEKDRHILTLTNVTNKVSKIEIPILDLHSTETHWYDLISKMEWMTDDHKLHLTLLPYDVIWLTPYSECLSGNDFFPQSRRQTSG